MEHLNVLLLTRFNVFWVHWVSWGLHIGIRFVSSLQMHSLKEAAITYFRGITRGWYGFERTCILAPPQIRGAVVCETSSNWNWPVQLWWHWLSTRISATTTAPFPYKPDVWCVPLVDSLKSRTRISIKTGRKLEVGTSSTKKLLLLLE